MAAYDDHLITEPDRGVIRDGRTERINFARAQRVGWRVDWRILDPHAVSPTKAKLQSFVGPISKARHGVQGRILGVTSHPHRGSLFHVNHAHFLTHRRSNFILP